MKSSNWLAKTDCCFLNVLESYFIIERICFMKKKIYKLLSVFVSILLILALIPLSAMAAPASDIPAEMLDNAFLRALAYTGYDVQAQKNDGTIYKQVTSSVPASVRSNIVYGTDLYGTETVSNAGTATGLAPNISAFENS